MIEGRAHVGLGHVAEASLPDPLAQQSQALAGVALVAHLSGDLLRLGELAQLAGLVNIVAQRLLAVDGQPGVEGADAGGKVTVIGRGDPNGVEMFLLIEELAVVAIDLRVGEPALDVLDRVGSVVEIHVGRRDNLLAGGHAHALATHAADADECKPDLLIGRVGAGHGRRADQHGGRHRCASLEKFSTGDWIGHGDLRSAKMGDGPRGSTCDRRTDRSVANRRYSTMTEDARQTGCSNGFQQVRLRWTSTWTRARFHIAEVDQICLWTWRPEDLKHLEANFTALEKIAPDKQLYLGCYMYGFHECKALPVALMQQQVELGYQWLKAGRIKGIIFLATPNVDVGLEAVEWPRLCIHDHADEPLPSRPATTRSAVHTFSIPTCCRRAEEAAMSSARILPLPTVAFLSATTTRSSASPLPHRLDSRHPAFVGPWLISLWDHAIMVPNHLARSRIT